MNTELSKNLKHTIRYGAWSELANLLRILNELLIMLVWFERLTDQQVHWGECLLVLGVIYLGSYLLSRILHSLKLKIGIERFIFAIWIVAALVLGFRLLLLNNISIPLEQFLPLVFTSEITNEATFAFWVLLFSMVTILHGVRATHSPVNTPVMINSVRAIIVLYAVFAVIFGHHQIGVFLPSFFVFLLSSLIGLSLTRIADLSEDHGGKLPGFNWQWAAGIGGIALAVILLSLISSLVFNLDVAKFCGKILTLLTQLFTGALLVVLTPIVYVIIAILQFIYKLLSPNLENVLEPNELLTGEQLLEDLQTKTAEAARIDPRLYVMIGVILLLAIIAVIQLRKRSVRRELVGEEDISQIEPVKKKESPFKNLLPAGIRLKKRASAKSLFAAARIRFTYGQLMDLCEKLGKPRPRCVTPLEFLPLMDTLFPPYHTDLETITHAYNKIRYGELPETEQEVVVVLDAWSRLSEYGREKLEVPSKNLRRKKR